MSKATKSSKVQAELFAPPLGTLPESPAEAARRQAAEQTAAARQKQLNDENAETYLIAAALQKHQAANRITKLHQAGELLQSDFKDVMLGQVFRHIMIAINSYYFATPDEILSDMEIHGLVFLDRGARIHGLAKMKLPSYEVDTYAATICARRPAGAKKTRRATRSRFRPSEPMARLKAV